MLIPQNETICDSLINLKWYYLPLSQQVDAGIVFIPHIVNQATFIKIVLFLFSSYVVSYAERCGANTRTMERAQL